MRRGTTPTHIFTLPFSTDNIQNATIVYAQKDCVVLSKTMSNLSFNDNTIELKLTQEDTLKLAPCVVDIQIRVLTRSGDALASSIMSDMVYDSLSDEVLV